MAVGSTLQPFKLQAWLLPLPARILLDVDQSWSDSIAREAKPSRKLASRLAFRQAACSRARVRLDPPVG